MLSERLRVGTKYAPSPKLIIITFLLSFKKTAKISYGDITNSMIKVKHACFFHSIKKLLNQGHVRVLY